MNERKDIGVGPTGELSLRVSVASLARVVFPDPDDESPLLALERKATLLSERGCVTVKAQPFGGALRINDPVQLRHRIGRFHFDSQKSMSEQDFRIFIQPADWGTVQDFCLEQLQSPDGSVLETAPDRELAEEFGEALGAELSPDQYLCQPLRTILENHPVPTENLRAERQPTVRLYQVYEVRVIDSGLMKAMISNNQRYSDREIQELARESARRGGKGWANTCMVLPADSLIKFYRVLPEKLRNSPIEFNGVLLEPNVTTLLDGVLAPKYQRV